MFSLNICGGETHTCTVSSYISHALSLPLLLPLFFQAEIEARKQAQARNATYISPYNDYDVMVGQGTIGVEISAQLAHLMSVKEWSGSTFELLRVVSPSFLLCETHEI
jgi:hypothetical protein